MEVKKIVEGMTAPQVAQVIDDNFKAQNAILEEDIAKQNNVIGVSEYKDFSEAEAVNVGDVRKYNGFLYECVEATTGAFDASKWKKSSFKAETEKKLSELGSYVENPEYARAYTDADGRLLWGIKHDGSIEFAKGVPTPIKKYIVEYVLSKLDAISNQLCNTIIPEIESLKETNEQYLKEYETPEWARVIVDADGKILWGIRIDGSVEFTKGIPSSIKAYIDSLDRNNDEEVERINQLVIGLLADVKVLTDTYHYVSNTEWVCAIVDAEERILMGIKADGSYYIPNRDMYHVESNPEYAKVVVDSEGHVLFGIRTDGSCYIPKGISEEAKKGLLELTARISWFDTDENPEWLQVTTDSEGRLLEGIGVDGKKYFPKQEMLEKYNDIEGRTEMTLDDEGRIISYRKKDGTKVEVKSEVHHLSIKESFSLKNKALEDFKRLVNSSAETYSSKDFNVPNYGYINIKSEVIFVDTEGNEYAPNNIEKVNGQYVVKSNNFIIVNESEKPIDISTWAPNKDKHYCKISYKWEDVDSESYAMVSFQGSSTLSLPKKNLRVVFYVDNLFSKKYKFKIGEMVETSKYNAKAFYADATRLRDITIQRLAVEARNLRDYSEQYPWNNDYPIYTGAVGTIVSFPIRIDVSGEFYGVFMFGLAKDDKNFMLDGDNTGMLISGDFHNDYPLSFAEFHGETWADEMNDDEELTEHGHTPSNYAALTSLWEWINNGVWDRATVPQHLSVPDFIDYYIFVQVFRMRDNDIHNIILYTKEDKKKFYAFLYDLDLSWGRGYNYDMPINEQRLILWKRFVGVYWEDIVERYWELRSTILNYSHVIGIVNKLQSSIPFSDFDKEMNRWDSVNYTDATKIMLGNFQDLLVHFDNFFSV